MVRLVLLVRRAVAALPGHRGPRVRQELPGQAIRRRVLRVLQERVVRQVVMVQAELLAQVVLLDQREHMVLPGPLELPARQELMGQAALPAVQGRTGVQGQVVVPVHMGVQVLQDRRVQVDRLAVMAHQVLLDPPGQVEPRGRQGHTAPAVHPGQRALQAVRERP